MSRDDSRVFGLSHWKDELSTIQMGFVWEGQIYAFLCPSVHLSVSPFLLPSSPSLPPLASSIPAIHVLSGDEVVTRQASSLLSWSAVL